MTNLQEKFDNLLRFNDFWIKITLQYLLFLYAALKKKKLYYNKLAETSDKSARKSLGIVSMRCGEHGLSTSLDVTCPQDSPCPRFPQGTTPAPQSLGFGGSNGCSGGESIPRDLHQTPQPVFFFFLFFLQTK